MRSEFLAFRFVNTNVNQTSPSFEHPKVQVNPKYFPMCRGYSAVHLECHRGQYVACVLRCPQGVLLWCLCIQHQIRGHVSEAQNVLLPPMHELFSRGRRSKLYHLFAHYRIHFPPKVFTSSVPEDGERLIEVANVLEKIFVPISLGVEAMHPTHVNNMVLNDVKVWR